MAYTEFETEFLVGCYSISEEMGEDVIPVSKVFEEFYIQLNERWIDRALESFVQRGLCTDMRTIGGGLRDDVWLNSRGYQEAERLIRAGVKIRRKPKKEEHPARESLPPGVKEVSGGKTYVVEGRVPDGFGQEGDMFFELEPKLPELSPDPEIAELEAKLVPAANRDVTIYHNQADASDAINQLESSVEVISQPNDPESLQLAMNAKTGVQYLKNCQEKDVPIRVGIFRYLVLDPFKKALESSIEDGWKLIIKGALLVLLAIILTGLGIL